MIASSSVGRCPPAAQRLLPCNFTAVLWLLHNAVHGMMWLATVVLEKSTPGDEAAVTGWDVHVAQTGCGLDQAESTLFSFAEHCGIHAPMHLPAEMHFPLIA